MALTPEQIAEYRKQYSIGASKVVAQPAMSISDKTKSLAVGFGKGLGSSVQGLQDLGQRGIAAIDPTKSYKDVKKETGINALENADFGAKNNYEKAGKAIEFVAEVLFPVGTATKGTQVATKTGEIVGASLDNIGSKVASISDDVMEGGVKVKDKIIDIVAGLDDKTKTALKRTPREVFDSFVEKGKNALLDDKNRTPLEDVGDKIIDGLVQMKDRATSIAQQKSQYLNQAKIGLQRVGNIVGDALLETQKVFNGMKLDAGDKKVVQTFVNELKNYAKNPTLKDVDGLIDLLQDGLYKASRSDAVEVTNRITGPLRQIVGKLNAKAGEIGGEAYKNFNKQYSELIEVVNELNARVGKEGGGAGSFVKRLFSPSDARTKYLFEQLEKFTGQDFFRDARLAKFVMDVLGDTRAANILQQIPTSAKGLVEKVMEKGVDLLRNPIKSAERFIEKQP